MNLLFQSVSEYFSFVTELEIAKIVHWNYSFFQRL